MRRQSKRIGLFILVVAMATTFTACDQAVFSDSNTENSFLKESSGTPFFEFQSGAVRDTLNESRSPSPVTLEVGPNVSLDTEISFEYEVSPGPDATSPGDFEDVTPNAPRVLPDTTGGSGVETDTLAIQVGGGNLTRNPRLVTISLTSVSTADGSELLLGRNGDEQIGRSRTIQIGPSIFVRTFGSAGLSTSANIFEVSFDTTAVGGASFPPLNPVLANGSIEATQASNFSITGPDADAFSFLGIGGLVREPGSSAVLAPSAGFPGNLGLINVRFQPSSTGEKSATLEFEMANSTDNTTVTLPLSGIAVSGGD